MKKSYFLLMIMLFVSCAVIQPEMLIYRDYAAEKVIESDLTKDELFIAANAWLIESFKSAKDVIQLSDKEAGVIILRYFMAGSPAGTEVTAVITLKARDNMTKISVVPQGIGKYYKPEPGFVVPEGTPGAEEIESKAAGLVANYESFIRDYKAW
jgi:hypothetical protein